MAETGLVRFPGSLDPGAQEFIPRNPNQLTLFGPPPPQPLPPPPHQVFYPYPPISEVVPYAQYAAPPAYASAAPTVCAPIPPPSAAATRAVLLSSVPSDMSEGTVRREVEGFGEVRWVQMERVCEGIVTVHFYDLRHAERALREFREQNMQQQQARLRNNYASYPFIPNTPPPLPPSNLSSQLLPVTLGRGLIAGQPVWAQFVIPALKAVPDGHNQGTVVIFNLDSAVSTSTLKDTFQAFGPVKELRETPSKKHQRFIEFFDVRDAAKALKEMNGKEINGKPVVIEFSRPGGHSRKYLNAVGNTTQTPVPPTNIIAPLHSNNALVSYPPSPSRELVGKFARRPNSLNLAPPPPRLYASLSPQIQFPSSRNKSTNICSSKGNVGANGSLRRSNSSSVEAQMGGLNLGGAVEESHLVPGQPKRSCSSSKKSCQNQVVMSPPRPQQAKSSRGRKGRQGKKMDSKFLIKEEAMAESSSADTRTTVMIKNIPNKYSQKLLLNMLDNHCIHCNEQIVDGGGDDGDDDEQRQQQKQPFSSYDFVYLPIDFNNKCNVGYGFVNMTSPEATWRLYKAFHLQHWEVFNSRKICEVTYARVQGLEALKEHFKNSKFPCEMEHYLPVVFSPPRDGRQLTHPLPIVGAQTPNNNININISSSSSSPVSLLLPPVPPHLHDQHDHDMDAPVSTCDSEDDDDDDESSSRSGGVFMPDDDDDDDNDDDDDGERDRQTASASLEIKGYTYNTL